MTEWAYYANVNSIITKTNMSDPEKLLPSTDQQLPPELLVGQLPPDLQSKIEAMLGPDVQYAIGVNQSGGAVTTEDASTYLEEQGGIAMDYFDFSSRFQIYDESNADVYAETSLDGFYGPEAGRFVTVFPTRPVEGMTPGQIARDYTAREYLPEDFIASSDDSEVVSAKYIAGFTDAQTGTFIPNKSFLSDEKADFSKVDTVADEDLLPAPIKRSPQEMRQRELEGHARSIQESMAIGAEQGIYPQELGSFVLNKLIDFDGEDFNQPGEELTGLQKALVERSDPGSYERMGDDAIKDRARDASGAKKTVRDLINNARTRSKPTQTKSVGNNGPLPPLPPVEHIDLTTTSTN